MFFFFKYTATTRTYTYLPTLSLHDALPISRALRADRKRTSHAAGNPRHQEDAERGKCVIRDGGFMMGKSTSRNAATNHASQIKNHGSMNKAIRVGVDRKSTRLNSSH